MSQGLINESSKRNGCNISVYKMIDEIEPVRLDRVVVNLLHTLGRDWTWKTLEQRRWIEIGRNLKLYFVLDTHGA